MESVKILLLAVMQGLTEFLPVSSSGHLVILQNLLGIESGGVRLEMMLHIGTLAAVVVFYWRAIWRICRGMIHGEVDAWREAGLLILATLPAVVIYFFVGDTIEKTYDSAKITGFMLMITGAILFATRYSSARNREAKKVGGIQAVLIGFAQAFALLPGISRSGATISAARFLGVSGERAAEFSFLMSLPVLVGGAIMELFSPVAESDAAAQGWGVLIPAMALAAVVGYASLRLVVRAITGNRFWIFGIYCFVVGIASVLFFG